MLEQTNRPILKLKLSIFEILLEVISLSFIIGTFIYLAIHWDTMPEKIPTHFGITGQVDRWGSKTSFLGVSVITGLLYLFLTLLCRFPHIFNYLYRITEKNAELHYRNARLVLSFIKVELIGYFTYTQYRSIIIAINEAESLGVAPLLIFLLILFLPIAYFIFESISIEKKLKC